MTPVIQPAPANFEIAVRLHDIPVHCVTDDAAVFDGVQRVFAAFGFEEVPDGAPDPAPSAADAGPPLHFEVRTQGSQVEPEGPAVVGETYGGLETWRFVEGVAVRGPGLSAFLQPEQGTARALVAPGSWEVGGFLREVEVTFILLCFMILLRHRGIQSIHSAALLRNRRGLLIVGTAGTGKSTLTLGLARAGWRPLTDDSLLVRERGGAVEALALRRDLYLPEDAIRGLAVQSETWKPSALTDSPKRWLDVQETFPGPQVHRCQPRVLLFPTLLDPHDPERTDSEIRPLPPAHALGKLIGQSFLIFLEPTGASVQIEVLRQLVAQSSSYELLAGRELQHHPERLAAILEPLLDASDS